MNRTLYILIVALVLIGAFWWLWSSGHIAGTGPSATSTATSTQDLSITEQAYVALNGAAITLPERPEVSLTVTKNSDGTWGAQWASPVDSSDRAFLSFPKQQYAAVVGHQANGAATLLVMPFYVNYGGSGTFLYLGLFTLTGNGPLIYRDAIALDDRVAVSSLVAGKNEGTAVLKFLTRYSDQGMATEPTVPAFEIFAREGDTLKVLMRGENVDMDTVSIVSPVAGAALPRDFIVTGSARGWYFEASFPIRVIDQAGNQLGQGVAQAQGDWMTTNPVPFKASVSVGKYQGPAILMLMKDNPSGEVKNDASIQIPITIQ